MYWILDRNVMGDCCNSEQVQQSFGEMTSSVKELLIRTSSALTEILSNITQQLPGAGVSSDNDSQENIPQTDIYTTDKCYSLEGL